MFLHARETSTSTGDGRLPQLVDSKLHFIVHYYNTSFI